MDQLMPRLSADGTRWIPHPADLQTQQPVQSDSGNVANAAAVGTIAAATGLMSYITGFKATAKGSNAGLSTNVTVAGLLGGSRTFPFTFPVGAAVDATPVVQFFDPPLPASALNVAITATLPAGGLGNTNAAISVFGFRGNANNT